MAKITFGPTVSLARGKIGDVVFSWVRGGAIARALSLKNQIGGPHNLLSNIHLDTSPATPPTQGDIILAQGSPTKWTRLAKGSEGQTIVISSGVPGWHNPPSGGVTSVALAMPVDFTVTGSPVTASGTLTAAWNTQAANTVLAGPATGADDTPTFRNLVTADIPNLDAAKITSGTFGSTRGGTGNAYTKFTGPTTTEKSFTLPDAGATILTDHDSVTIPQGGTGAATKAAAMDALSPLTTIGDLLTHDGTHNVRFPKGTDGQLLSLSAGALAWEDPPPTAKQEATVLPGAEALIAAYTATAVTVWPTANLAIFVPFTLQENVTVKRLIFAVGTGSGHYDAGIYDQDGNRKIALGATALSGTNTTVVADIADTALTAGRYYAALVIDNITATPLVSLQFNNLVGCKEQTSAYPLPLTATYAQNLTRKYVPLIAVTLES